jgi:hypothetical protein
MKKQGVATLNQIFSSKKALSSKKMNNPEWSDNISKLKESFAKESKFFWPAVCAIVLKKIMEVINVKVVDVLVPAWNKYREIQQYADLKKYPPDKIYMVPLAEHVIKSEYTPELEIFINNQSVCTLRFSVEVSLTLGGVILEIKGGKIMKLHTGSCKGAGSIACEGFLIINQKTSPFTLPGEITLGEGVPISKFAA